MNLPRKRAKPRRKTHPVRPPGERLIDIPEIIEISERSSPEYRAVVDDVKRRAGGMCEARLDGCSRVGAHPHHVWPVSEGGPVVVPSVWLRWVCPQCHGVIHSGNGRPEAEALGLIVPRDR